MSTKWIEYTKGGVEKPPDDMLSPAEVRDRQGQQEDKKIFCFQRPSTLTSGICRSGRPVPEHLTRAVMRKSSRFCCVVRTVNFAELLLSCKSGQAVFGDNHTHILHQGICLVIYIAVYVTVILVRFSLLGFFSLTKLADNDTGDDMDT
jgi:hypothetical protein